MSSNDPKTCDLFERTVVSIFLERVKTCFLTGREGALSALNRFDLPGVLCGGSVLGRGRGPPSPSEPYRGIPSALPSDLIGPSD